MASSYSTNLGLELPATGEKSGVWGDIVNTNLGTLLEQAISGYVSVAITDGADTTITMPNGATGVARNMYLVLTGGSLTAPRNLIVPAQKKLYFVYNNYTYYVTVKCAGQTGVAVLPGHRVVLACDGTDVVLAINAMYGDITGNAATVTNGLYSSESYPDPSWITSLGASKLTGTLSSDRLPIVPVTKGGTGSDNASAARIALSVPSTTGSGASGSWNINANYATNAGYATTAGSTSTAGNVSGVVQVANGGTGSSSGGLFLHYSSGTSAVVTHGTGTEPTGADGDIHLIYT